MKVTFPHQIENHGERIVFTRTETTDKGLKLIGDTFCQPGSGPPMHTHFKQDEGMKVLSGKMGYQIQGQKPQYASVGESVVFERGLSHKFWAEGNEPLHCEAWLLPAHTSVFFLSSIFAAQLKSGSDRPEIFDLAYLSVKYRREYRMDEAPMLVRKLVLPVVYFIGIILRKYPHFKGAPEPIK